MTISDLTTLTATATAEIRCQITAHSQRQTSDGKPYLHLEIADSTGTETLRIWSDSGAYSALSLLSAGAFISIVAEWSRNKYGVDSKQVVAAQLSPEDTTALLAGSPERIQFLESLHSELLFIVNEMSDPTFKALSLYLIVDRKEPFIRAAAARVYHQSRRGGLLEHTTAMVKSAVALSYLYTHIRKDLLIAGAIWHDAGKLVENQYEKSGFSMPYTARAELYGHIPIGLQMLHRAWSECIATPTPDPRLDLLSHLILSHHGTLEWGSPVEPKIPEAILLHFIDNIDAKLEMFRQGSASAPEVGTHVLDRIKPLYVHPVTLTYPEPQPQPQP